MEHDEGGISENENLHAPPSPWWGRILAIYWIVLFTATHVPPALPGLPGGGVDKLAHLAAYAVLAGLIACYWQVTAGWLVREHFMWIVAGCSLYGAADELLQIPVGRHASVSDWAADTGGALLGVLAFWLLRSLTLAARQGDQ